MQKRACLPEHWGRVKSSGLSVQVARGKVKSQEGRERREGIEVHVSTGYWLPGEFEGWGDLLGTTSCNIPRMTKFDIS